MSERGASDWTIITVLHNSQKQLERCWGALELDGGRWLAVDNASKDGSVECARDLGAEVITLDRNVGFAAANNLALVRVRTDWTAFVNPDVTVGSSTDLQQLAKVAEGHGALVSPQLLHSDGTEQPNGRGLPYLADKFAHRSFTLPGARLREYVRQSLQSRTYVAWVIGAAVTGRTTTFRSLGGWDERFFLYYEDHELGLRAWSSGVPVVLDPSIRWMHEWQRETSHLRVRPWMRELSSGLKFYRRYPALLSRRLRLDAELTRLAEVVWTEAEATR